MTYKNCQSCGMPLSKDEKGGGTNADGSKSNMYCSRCYETGSFTRPNITAAEMQGLVKSKLKELGFPGFIASWFTKGIPKLERWKNATLCAFLSVLALLLLNACQNESKKPKEDHALLVCNLTSKQLQEREEYLRKEVFSKLEQTIELEDGYEFIFKQPIDYSITLSEFINFERKCCPGLTYTLTFDPEEGPIHLKIGNSKEIKEALKAELENLTH